jgi:hypothetical protein
MSHDCKCPRCEAQGYIYLEEGRKYFHCYTCQLNCLLKLLASYKI